MCLQGFDQSGQEQSVRSSLARAGKSETPARSNSVSMSSGISPAISLATCSALSATAAATRDRSAFASRLTAMVTRYGVGRNPCTSAFTRSGSMSMERTCPLRAYDRPRRSRPPRFSASSTATHRRDHHCLPKLRALIPPRASRGREGGKYGKSDHRGISLPHRVRAQCKEIAQLRVRQLRQPSFSAAHHRRGQLLLPFDHLVDLLLHRSPAHELVHLHVACLPDAEGPVGGLILHCRVPPAIEMKHVAGPRQIQPRPSR